MKYIGIDTGKHTGVAIWDREAHSFEGIWTLPIHKAMALVLDTFYSNEGQVKVYFEDARKRKWIPREKSLSEWKGKVMGAGSVKRDAVIWEDFLTDYSIPFEMVAPRPHATKWKPEYFKHITGWSARTSEHARDAAILVFQR